MIDHERTVLDHYNLTNPYPTEWPAEKDGSDDSEGETAISTKTRLNVSSRRPKSRYSVLERRASDRRSLVPGSEKTGEGRENLVQKDEADPLGGTNSVVRSLQERGLPVGEDQRLRNRFLLSSTTFSPTLFLSQVHSDASEESLHEGLEFLSKSIDQKSASLKVLVESNFERFVRAKATIDNVYTEMRNQGSEPEPEPPRTPRTHSRHVSRNQTHFRNASGQGPPTPGKGSNKPLPSDKKKNALTKESEYGVQGIKAPLIEIAAKAEEVWGPALGGREREETLRLMLASVERCKGTFLTGAAISDCINRQDYDGLVEEYGRARRYADDAREVASKAIHDQNQLTEPQVHQIVITGRMWLDVEAQIDKFKRDIWRKLTNVQANVASLAQQNQREEHMALISILLELGVEDNPIWIWLLSRYEYLKNKISVTFERARVEIEVLRRHLANSEKPSTRMKALHLKNAARQNGDDTSKGMDTVSVIELWDLINASMNSLLSTHGGVLGEVIDFWDRAKAFMDGKVQNALPVGFDGRSKQHHRLSTDGMRDLQNGAAELVDIMRDQVFSFFVDPPIEDISMLFSPLPPNTPSTPGPAPRTPGSAQFPRTPGSARFPFLHQDSRFKFDAENPPPSSPKKGESWEEFAFWPPHANSLSGVYYLSKLLGLVGTAAIEMTAMRPVSNANSSAEKLKALVGVVRERSARAICAAWSTDAEMCRALEDWTRSTDRRDLTRMPSHFSAFESTILSRLQRILYIPEASVTKPGTVAVVSPPPTKLLEMVRKQFISSLYQAFSGMVENAQRPMNVSEDTWASTRESVTATLPATAMKGEKLNARSRNIRMLLTLSNLKALRADIVPHLTNTFETNFSTALADESRTIRDHLDQIDARLFHAYTKPTSDKLADIIHVGISAPTWVPDTPRPTEVRSYIYTALLLLVFVHTEVSTTAAPLTNLILAHFLEQVSHFLLQSFSARQRYPLPALMQATLDVEFLAATLSQYTTDQASETQSRIYMKLDQGTDNDARKRLQDELPQMRAILKRLKEGTRAEFAGFRKQKVPGQREGGSERSERSTGRSERSVESTPLNRR